MKSVTLYCAEQYDRKKYGNRCVKFCCENMTEDEINEKINELRAEQKQKNIEYRASSSSSSSRNREEIREEIHEEIREIREPGVLKLKNSIPLMVDSQFLKLDPGTGNTCVLLGSSKRGKSTLLTKLASFNKKGINILFSINSHCDVYNGSGLIKCNKFNKEAIELVREAKKIQNETKNKYEFNFYFDDVTQMQHSDIIRQLILTYRNAKISTYISLQYSNLLQKAARGSVNTYLLFGFNNDEAIEQVINQHLKSYFSRIGVKGMENQINYYRDLTDDHQFVMLHPESGTIKLLKLKL